MNPQINIESLLSNYDLVDMRKDLLQWWHTNKREFPWRDTRNPYRLVIAEILLHRTRAEQVVPLYDTFIRRFPDVFALAEGTLDEVSTMLYSGGLHWRWKLLHSLAQQVAWKLSGEIPKEFNELVSLPGISHYIASAVRCFAFGYPDVLLDTNTVRIAGRVFGLSITDSSRRSRLFRSIMEQWLDTQHPREFNFGLIDLAAEYCTAKLAHHEQCCLRKHCIEDKTSCVLCSH